MGLNALLFLLCRLAIMKQRRFLTGQSFLMVWVGFAAISFLYVVLNWFAFAVLSFGFPPVREVVVTTTFGIFIFPIVNAILNLSYKTLLSERVSGDGAIG